MLRRKNWTNYMKQSYSQLSLEDLATIAVQAGREFAIVWRDYPKLISAAESKSTTLKSIGRLHLGEAFNQKDEASLDEVELQLTNWFNSIQFQYRELVLDGRNGEAYFIEDEQTKDVRLLILKYLTFRASRQDVIDRVTAGRGVESLQRSK